MKKLNRGLLAGVAASTLLTACSGGVDAPAPPPTATPGAPTPAPVALQDQFGAIFSVLFSGSVEVEATEPAATAVPPLDLSKEAING